MSSGLNSTSIFKICSASCPNTDNPFTPKWVFFDYKSLSLNIQDNNWRRLNVSDSRVGQTLSQETFLKSWKKFYFVPSMIHDTKAITWRKSFIANIFEWTENPSLLEVSVSDENGWFYGSHFPSEGKAYFVFSMNY